MPKFRVGGTLILALSVLAGTGARAATLGEALASLDSGDDATARASLAAQIGELSFYQALAEQGDARKAAAQRAVDLNPSGSWIQVAAQGLLAEASGDLDAAVADLEKATSLSPNDFRLWNELAELYVRQEDSTKGLAAFQRATTLNPSYAVGLIGLGNVLRRNGQFGDAYNAFNHAVGSDSKPLAALMGRANARLYLGDTQGALNDLNQAVQISEPGADRSRALMSILNVETYLRRLPEGLDKAEQAARMWGEMGRADMVAGTFNAAGRVLLETGEAEAAESWYERGWQAIQVSNMPAEERTIWQVRWLHGLSRCAAMRRDSERANSLADQARALMDADTANKDHYAWIGPYLDGYLALAQRRYEDAIADFKKSDLTRPHLMMLLGEAYARNRDRADAREWYQKALTAATGIDTESVIVRPAATEWLSKNK